MKENATRFGLYGYAKIKVIHRKMTLMFAKLIQFKSAGLLVLGCRTAAAGPH